MNTFIQVHSNINRNRQYHLDLSELKCQAYDLNEAIEYQNDQISTQ